MIKFKIVALAILMTGTTLVYAQTPAPTQAPAATSQNDKLELAKVKVENLQLKQQLIQASFTQLQSQYKEISEQLNTAQAEVAKLTPKPVHTETPKPAEKK